MRIAKQVSEHCRWKPGETIVKKFNKNCCGKSVTVIMSDSPGISGEHSSPSNCRDNFSRRFLALASLLLCFLALPSFLQAEHTRRWRQSSYEDFLKGTAHGIAVRSDGRLELSPKFTLLAEADTSYLWALHVAPNGALYAAGGSPAKVFRFDSAGKPVTAFESNDLSARAIAFDAKGILYVATSPDGKVYRVSSSGEKTIFFDPRTKYIWDLAFGPDGNLYVATGDKGQIFSVAPDGKSELFYASDEAHIRVLTFTPHGDLLAGTEPSGRILRITRPKGIARGEKNPSGAEGFVLYETSKREVTALASAPDGTIYAAAIGEKQHPTPAPSAVIVTSQATTMIAPGNTITATGAQGGAPFLPFPPLLSSSIYRIAPDGAPEELWNSRDDVVYSLGIAADGRLLAGTGNNGALLAIDGHGVFAQLAKSGSAQITGIARNKDGKTFLCTANPGKVFSVGPEYEPEGTYESRPFDAQLFSQWGSLEWFTPPFSSSSKSSSNLPQPRLEFFVRSGNTEDPGKEWSPWRGPYTRSGAAMEVPSARFVQWKAVIHGDRPGDGIEWVSIAYLPRNVAPVIDGIALQEPGSRAQAPTIITGQPQTVALKPPASPNSSGIVISTTPSRFEPPPQGFKEKGYQSVLWTAHDDNDDELRYSIFFRGENEREWKLLKDKLEQKFYSWDTTALPDGAYYLKIVASDAPSNSPSAALTVERESERFEVDNTAPVIEHLEASVSAAADKNHSLCSVKFTARDATTSIDRAEYSVDGGDWIRVSPVGNISDSPEEHYEFSPVENLAPGEHTIAVRAYDRFENVGSAKTTVMAGAAKP